MSPAPAAFFSTSASLEPETSFASQPVDKVDLDAATAVEEDEAAADEEGDDLDDTDLDD